jgi:hypothetical protein
VRRTIAVTLALFGAHAAIAGTDPPPWVTHDDARLGLTFRHPADATIKTSGTVVTIAAPGLATVTIAIAKTDERSIAKNGGVSDKHVAWSIDVPLRSARCTADGATLDQATLASNLCDSIVLAPGPRHPHVELSITATGLADAAAAAYQAKVRARQKPLDACWKAALGKDADLPEGSLTLERSYADGQPAESKQRVENFFDHDAKALAACVFGVLQAVPARTTGAATVRIEAICQLY